MTFSAFLQRDVNPKGLKQTGALSPRNDNISRREQILERHFGVEQACDPSLAPGEVRAGKQWRGRLSRPKKVERLLFVSPSGAAGD